MPYVEQHRRDQLDKGLMADTPGDLNYLLAKQVDEYIGSHRLSYKTLNDVLGVLTALSYEIYRRIAADYEDIKIEENGDVFHRAIALLHKAQERMQQWKDLATRSMR